MLMMMTNYLSFVSLFTEYYFLKKYIIMRPETALRFVHSKFILFYFNFFETVASTFITGVGSD